MKISEYENHMKNPTDPVANISFKGVCEQIGKGSKTHFTCSVIVDDSDEETMAFMRMLRANVPNNGKYDQKPVGPFKVRMT